jgi:4-deoxy-L-threo-5-hexosulose-uronate ketol-isomerase
MKIHWMADQVRYQGMTTGELRETFLLESLVSHGEIRLAYIDVERAIVGMATPHGTGLSLPNDPILRASSFLERRELGALNIGGNGRIRVGEESYPVDRLDCLYIGRGSGEVVFESINSADPAVFYLLSYPAHHSYPTALVHKGDAIATELGSSQNANHREVYKYIHAQGVQSCQLVMGVTHLRTGSIWNTMPPHTHSRRSEIYMYFNLEESERVFHFMGPPDETRHLMIASRQVVISPAWSIHAGAGSSAYSFCWGMGGENQDYADMDAVAIRELL